VFSGLYAVLAPQAIRVRAPGRPLEILSGEAVASLQLVKQEARRLLAPTTMGSGFCFPLGLTVPNRGISFVSCSLVIICHPDGSGGRFWEIVVRSAWFSRPFVLCSFLIVVTRVDILWWKVLESDCVKSECTIKLYKEDGLRSLPLLPLHTTFVFHRIDRCRPNLLLALAASSADLSKPWPLA